jgi:hypothetical protein
MRARLYTACKRTREEKHTGQTEMKKSQALDYAAGSRATLKPARGADAQLDHLEYMITSFVNSTEIAPLGCLDRPYWRMRLRVLSEENDLVSVQRARVLKLLDMLDQKERKTTGPEQAAA